MSMSPDKPTMAIVSVSHKSVDDNLTTFEPCAGNMVITPSMYVAPHSILILLAASLKGRHTHAASHRPTSQSQCYHDCIPRAWEPPTGPDKHSSYASMQVYCKLHRDIALNNNELGSLRHLGFRMHMYVCI